MSSSSPDQTREKGNLDPYKCTQIEDIISVGHLGELDCVGSDLEAVIEDWPPGSCTASTSPVTMSDPTGGAGASDNFLTRHSEDLPSGQSVRDVYILEGGGLVDEYGNTVSVRGSGYVAQSQTEDRVISIRPRGGKPYRYGDFAAKMAALEKE